MGQAMITVAAEAEGAGGRYMFGRIGSRRGQAVGVDMRRTSQRHSIGGLF